MENLDKKVLIVDDDKDFRWILEQKFAGKGFSLVFAEDGEEGLKMAEKEKPDLILLDILMPKMDGVTMAKKLKEKGINSKIIFLSSLKGELPVAQGLVEKTGYIIKDSLSIDQIFDRVKEGLGIK